MIRLTTVYSMLLVFSLSQADNVLAADKNNRNNAQRNDEKREDEAVKKAKADVNNAEREVNEAERAFKQANDKLKGAELDQTRAASKLQKIRDDLEVKHADLTGLTSARKKLDEARKSYEKAGEPILKALRDSDKFKSAVDAAKQADRKMTALREDGGDPSERIKQLAELAKQKLIPTQLERESLDAEESLKPQRQQLRDAESAVAKSADEMEKLVEKDPELKSAKNAFEHAKDHAADCRKTAAKESKQLADARQKLAKEQRDLQQKIAADKKDDNRNKPKGKK